MTYYTYDLNGFLTGSGNAQIDQLKGKDIYCLPQNSTFIEPVGALKENESFVFENGSWVIKTDITKTVYYSKNDMSVKKYERGETPDLTIYTDKIPIEKEMFQKFENDVWVVDNVKKIDTAKAQKVNEINSLCAQNIISGFESNALGEVYIYDSEEVDQLNLIGSVASGGTVFYKCQNIISGVKQFVSHTATQIKKVLQDGATRKTLLLQNCTELKNTVNSLTDYNSVVNFNINTGWV